MTATTSPTANASAADPKALESTWAVEGMTCASCAARVEKAVQGLPGVLRAEVNLANDTLMLSASAAPDALALQQVLDRAGYKLQSRTHQIGIKGMTCASCVGRVEKALLQVRGVLDAQVNLATEAATVTAASRTSRDALVAAIERAGYEVRAEQASAEDEQGPWLSEGRRVVLAALLSAPLVLPMVGMLWGEHPTLPAWWQWLLATPVQLWLGARFYRADRKSVV